ncbi:ATPase, T2SS/T4P/T4SS family [Martelella alba]|uniref:Type II secretion system protein GspE n=1 Tax=Martelella alba TaxID=2590451 RepID=A0ABY2SSB4_9HYPH|nr:ATPase, T2SS/T4P/T4SS family [Martelella alba]TKI08770.1 type II secretion system protein GspE [Martelella alba]
MINAESPPVPLDEFITHLLAQAVDRQASDIHIEPLASTACRIRLRIDGLLRQGRHCDPPLAARLTVGLKMMAGMDIAERRLPQDGQFAFGPPDAGYSCRVSSLPTLSGEKLVLRLLRRRQTGPTLAELGMPPALRRRFLRLLRRPHGLVLLTGPTGSGKTLTLYAALGVLKRRPMNICTVEDPVEIPLTDINQCQVNHKARLDFPVLLRAMLRQDPDVIMVGEIRDAATAAIALHAAQTGHLVLSTLHTAGAGDCLRRLCHLGLTAEQVAPVLRLVMAQRLVRRLCPACRREAPSPDRDGRFYSRQWRAVGCALCHEGYHGRQGLFYLRETSAWRDEASMEDTETENNLRDAGRLLVEQGLTTLTELNRVLGRPA